MIVINGVEYKENLIIVNLHKNNKLNTFKKGYIRKIDYKNGIKIIKNVKTNTL